MVLTRSLVWLLGVLALVSLACLLGFFGALTDMWHMLGRPDVWSGAGPGSAEWRFLAIGFWPMLAFHLVWVFFTFRALAQSRQTRG